MFIHRLPSSRISTRCSLIAFTYVGWPYGASPITLYSPEFTLKPVKYVNAEYSRPSEWGNRCSRRSVSSWPRPTPMEEVAHSPTPSIVTMAASSNGDG